MTIKKAIALILVLAILAAGGYYLLKTEQEDSDRMRSLYTEVEPLEREREALVAEKKAVETDYAVKMRDYGTVEILFTTLDSQIYTDAYPIMRERGVVGVMCVSYTEFPIYYSKLTVDQMKSLLNDGWGVCVLIDAPVGDFTSWFTTFAQYMEQQELPAPTSVYFTNNTYDISMDQALVECGIKTVILDTTDGRSRTVTDLTGDLWFTGALPFGYTGSAKDLELLGRTDASNMVLTMKITEIWDKSKNRNIESQEKQIFTDTLDSWKELLYEEDPLEELEQVGPTPYIYVDTNDPDVLHELYLDTLTPEQELLLPKFRSVNFERALDLHREAAADAVVLSQEKEQQVQALDSEISALEARIRSIYDQYGVGNKEEAKQNS